MADVTLCLVQRHGQGKMTEKDGSEYVGDWVKDVREGKGTHATSYGHTYEGQWKEDKVRSPCSSLIVF
jgi:hypothetical protein